MIFQGDVPLLALVHSRKVVALHGVPIECAVRAELRRRAGMILSWSVPFIGLACSCFAPIRCNVTLRLHLGILLELAVSATGGVPSFANTAMGLTCWLRAPLHCEMGFVPASFTPGFSFLGTRVRSMSPPSGS